MTLVQAPGPTQQQQFLNNIAARLAQLAKDPPDLLSYLRSHAECVVTAFKPTGFAYEMQSGSGFQRALQGNFESLGYKNSPEQENAFQRARDMAAAQRKPVILPPNTRETTGGQRGATPTDSPAPDELALFNYTSFEQVFVPIPLGDHSAGVLHVWFPPANNATAHARVALLRQFCGEIESYLKARRARDSSDEITRLTTYARLLEELTGDIDLDSVGWKLVNYAREAVACDRVCLFVASHYAQAVNKNGTELEHDFQLQACSGLKRPHPKSEQAVVLQNVAQTLTELSVERLTAQAAPQNEDGEPKRSGEKDGKPPMAIAPNGNPKVQMTLMMRDPSKTATRPPEVNDYFDVMPMNWATVIPLFDRDHRLCGILLFEGTKLEERLGASLKPMSDLAVAAGRSLGTTLYHSQNRSMRFARRVVAMRQEFINTPFKRSFMRYGLPILLVVAALACPISYSVKANASVSPIKQIALPALVNAPLLEVGVREGEMVKKGQILARFDTKEIELQLTQAWGEYNRAAGLSEAATRTGREEQMRISRADADKARATVERYEKEREHAVLVAPFDGEVLGAQTLSTRVGEVLHLGETALQVIDPSAWQVKATMKERELVFLDRRLHQHGPIGATLRLAADPTRKYELQLNAPGQLANGLDTSTGEYQFTAVLPLNDRLVDPKLLKAGFTGRISFEGGVRSVSYVFFKDFLDYLTVRFF